MMMWQLAHRRKDRPLGSCEVRSQRRLLNFRPNFARYFERRSELFEDFLVLKETAKSFLAASAIESDSRQTLITCLSWMRSNSSSLCL